MAQKEPKDWITVNGKHIPIYDGESKQDAYNRAVAKSNDDIKNKQIDNRKDEVERLNKKSSTDDKYLHFNKSYYDNDGKEVSIPNKETVDKEIQSMMNDITKSKTDKSLSKSDKKAMIDSLKKRMGQLSDAYENSGSNILNKTGSLVWYTNKAGTIFVLGKGKHWYKFGNDLSFTDDGKISDDGWERARKLLGI